MDSWIEAVYYFFGDHLAYSCALLTKTSFVKFSKTKVGKAPFWNLGLNFNEVTFDYFCGTRYFVILKLTVTTYPQFLKSKFLFLNLILILN